MSRSPAWRGARAQVARVRILVTVSRRRNVEQVLRRLVQPASASGSRPGGRNHCTTTGAASRSSPPGVPAAGPCPALALPEVGVVVDIARRQECSRIGREYSVESLWMSVAPTRSADLARAAVGAAL